VLVVTYFIFQFFGVSNPTLFATAWEMLYSINQKLLVSFRCYYPITLIVIINEKVIFGIYQKILINIAYTPIKNCSDFVRKLFGNF